MSRDPLHHTSVIFPAQPQSLESIVEFGRLALESRVRRMWLGQSLELETHLTLAAVAGQVPGLSLGTSVVLAPLRHPFEAANEARTIAALSGAPYVSGWGTGSREFQQGLLGGPISRPLRTLHEYGLIMRLLLSGNRVTLNGHHYQLNGSLTALPAPPVEVGFGVLRRKMAETAGRVADVAITWLTPSGYVGEVIVPALAAGAAEVGRVAPRVATVVHAAVTRPARDPRRIVLAAAGPHLVSGHYVPMLRTAGLDIDPASPAAGADLLLSSGLFATGSPQEIAAELRRYRQSGVDEVILNVCGVYRVEGLRSAMADVREILAAVAEDSQPDSPD